MESGSGSRTIEQSPTTEVVSPSPLPGADEFVLSDQQLELHRVLSEKNAKAAEWYRGGLIARANTSNPERFVHAAHSVRELMKNLHLLIDVAPQSDTARLGDKFTALADKWDKAKKSTSCHNDGVWDGPIDNHLRRALGAVDKTVAWFRTNRPKMREASMALFRQPDVSRRPLPPSLESRYYDKWGALYDYFVNVAHHGRETNEVEFDANLYAFERFVLDLVEPKTLQEQTLIDELISEAESGA